MNHPIIIILLLLLYDLPHFDILDDTSTAKNESWNFKRDSNNNVLKNPLRKVLLHSQQMNEKMRQKGEFIIRIREILYAAEKTDT